METLGNTDVSRIFNFILAPIYWSNFFSDNALKICIQVEKLHLSFIRKNYGFIFNIFLNETCNKVPIISEEFLLALTLKKKNVCQFFQLIKKSYVEELALKRSLSKNALFFTFFFKSSVSKTHLKEVTLLHPVTVIIMYFRKKLLSKILSQRILLKFFLYVKKSIVITPKRQY